MSLMKAHRIVLDDQDRMEDILIHPASEGYVEHVLEQSEDDPEGRSNWVWIRLPNGDLVLGVYPQGDTYSFCEDDAQYPTDVDELRKAEEEFEENPNERTAANFLKIAGRELEEGKFNRSYYAGIAWRIYEHWLSKLDYSIPPVEEDEEDEDERDYPLDNAINKFEGDKNSYTAEQLLVVATCEFDNVNIDSNDYRDAVDRVREWLSEYPTKVVTTEGLLTEKQYKALEFVHRLASKRYTDRGAMPNNVHDMLRTVKDLLDR